jgi:hypothetical protein
LGIQAPATALDGHHPSQNVLPGNPTIRFQQAVALHLQGFLTGLPREAYDAVRHQSPVCQPAQDDLAAAEALLTDWLNFQQVPITDERAHTTAVRLETQRTAVLQYFNGQVLEILTT